MLIENYIVVCNEWVLYNKCFVWFKGWYYFIEYVLLFMVCWYLLLCNKFVKYNKWLNDVFKIFYFVLVFILKNYEMLRNIDLNR